MDSEIRRQIREFIADNFLFRGAIADLGDDDVLLDAGILDAAGVHELLAFLRDRFGLAALADVAPESLGSISLITAFVIGRWGEIAAAAAA